MEKRDNKYHNWVIGLGVLGIHELTIGALLVTMRVPLIAIAGNIMLWLCLPDILLTVIFAVYDNDLNREYEKHAADKKKWAEYQKLKGEFDDKK